MKSEFKNPISEKPIKNKKSAWNYDQPPYDERSSCYINTGSNYGVGHKQPVGTTGKPKSPSSVIPQGVKMMNDNE